MIQSMTRYRIKIDGKSTNKQEFVTCGGIQLPEVDFTTMESKKAPNLFFAGECLDIDGVPVDSIFNRHGPPLGSQT